MSSFNLVPGENGQYLLTYSASTAIESPKLVLIIGSVGLALNILSATLLHEHHGHDHGGHGHGHSHSHTESHSHEPGHEHEHNDGPVNIEAAIPSSQDSRENIVLTVSAVVSPLFISNLTNTPSSLSALMRSTDIPSSSYRRQAAISG